VNPYPDSSLYTSATVGDCREPSEDTLKDLLGDA